MSILPQSATDLIAMKNWSILEIFQLEKIFWILMLQQILLNKILTGDIAERIISHPKKRTVEAKLVGTSAYWTNRWYKNLIAPSWYMGIIKLTIEFSEIYIQKVHRIHTIIQYKGNTRNSLVNSLNSQTKYEFHIIVWSCGHRSVLVVCLQWDMKIWIASDSKQSISFKLFGCNFLSLTLSFSFPPSPQNRKLKVRGACRSIKRFLLKVS